MSESTTREIIDRIFKEPGIKYELTEFENLGKPIHEILDIHAKIVDTGRDTGKTKYFLKSLVPFSSGKEEFQVYVEGGKSAPEEIADLVAESFSEPEPELTDTESGERDFELEEPELRMAAEGNQTLEERISEAEEKRDSLKAELIRVKQKLDDLASDVEAFQQQHRMEMDVIVRQWEGTKRELQIHLKPIKAEHQAALKRLKDKQKIKQRTYKAEIKHLEKKIPEAETAVKLLTNKGKLELILEDPELIGTLKERWIAAEAAKRLDYPIFMAVSERGGKNNSGDYEYRVDEDGQLVEFPDGHPHEGQLVVDQDLVNYDLTAAHLEDADKIPEKKLCVAEAFVRFARNRDLISGRWGDGGLDLFTAYRHVFESTNRFRVF